MLAVIAGRHSDIKQTLEMKQIKLTTLIFALLLFGCNQAGTSGEGQNQTNTPQDSIKSRRANYSEAQLKEADTSRVPMSMVRNVKQARNGDILIASYLGVFRYDGTSFTNLTSKISSPRFSSFWDVLEDRKGNLWFASKRFRCLLLQWEILSAFYNKGWACQ